MIASFIRKPLSISIGSLLLISACTTPPQFPDSSTMIPDAYRGLNLENASNAETIELSTWWLSFNDPVLNQLIDNALTVNTEIKIAQSRLEQAQALQKGAFSRLLPNVGLGAQRERYDGGNRNIQFLQELGVNQVQLDRWQAAVQASWEIDIFGANRARYFASQDQVSSAIALTQATRQSVAATTASIYFNYRAAQLREQLLEQNLMIASELLSITQSGFKGGITTGTDIDFAKASVELAKTQLAQSKQLTETLAYALENLSMSTPGALQGLLTFPKSYQLPSPASLAQIPLGQPIDLLYRRPDIMAAQARFNASLNQASAARRDYFPKFSLDAALSRGAYSFGGNGFNPANNLLYLGLGLVLPIFDFGARAAQVELADGVSKESWELLHKSILDALFDVERTLVEVKRQDQQGSSLLSEVNTREEILRKFRRQFKVGEVGRLDVLTARATLLNSQQSLLNQQLGRLQTQIVLYKALGGGWKNLGSN